MDWSAHHLRGRRCASLWPYVLLLQSLGDLALFLEVLVLLIRFHHSRFDQLFVLRVSQWNERDVVVLLALSVGLRDQLRTSVLETQFEILVDGVLLDRGTHGAQSRIRGLSGFGFLLLGGRFARVGSLAGLGGLSTAHREP